MIWLSNEYSKKNYKIYNHKISVKEIQKIILAKLSAEIKRGRCCRHYDRLDKLVFGINIFIDK